MLTKSQRYWADGEGVKEAVSGTAHARQAKDGSPPSMVFKMGELAGENRNNPSFQSYMLDLPAEAGRNFRSVLSISTQPYSWAMCKACQKIYSPERFRRLHRDNGRRVCRCGAKEWLSHYASFPEALVEPLIKSSTSEGCCPTCGAGWARVISTTRSLETGRHTLGLGPKTGGDGMTRHGQGATSLHHAVETRTHDWRPTCTCPLHAPVPAVVLDPFSGVGTVAFVAAKLGRKGIGVDLSWEYSRMAEARIAKGDSWDPPAVPEAQMALEV